MDGVWSLVTVALFGLSQETKVQTRVMETKVGDNQVSTDCMEGIYVSPDTNMQLVIIHAFEQCVPVEWQVITHQENQAWSCIIKKKDGAFYDDNGNEVMLTPDSIQWFDGTIWKRIAVSSTQMYLLTRRRPVFYTPLLLFLCFVVFDFVKVNAVLLKDKVLTYKISLYKQT